jgi:glucose-6-phosphate isomerase
MHLLMENIPEFKHRPLLLPDAPFLKNTADVSKLEEIFELGKKYKNILVIGHGGSITGFKGISQSMNHPASTLSTVDPEYIHELKQRLEPEHTLVVAVSKSGETVTQIEALMHFIDYPLFFITGKDSTLEKIGKLQNATILEHPPIGGRYTAFTDVALVPAVLAGVAVQDIIELLGGAHEFYDMYDANNIAMDAAQIFFELEQQGIVDVFMPFYSHSLFSYSDLIVQLCHESFGKNNVGQTYFAHEAPESQHHTNQRFFGGRKNIAGFFVSQEQFRIDHTTIVPQNLMDIQIKDGTLRMLSGIPLSKAMDAEFRGTWQDAHLAGIPIVALEMQSITPHMLGRFIAFWQLYAVYSSVIRGVDPFDQPQVESSKKISWNIRKSYG